MINKIINRPGSFSTKINNTKIILYGAIKYDANNNLILECSTEVEHFSILKNARNFIVNGEVYDDNLSCCKVTLLKSNTYHASYRMNIGEPDKCSFSITPSEVILGRNCDEQTRIKKITYSPSIINNIFAPADVEFTSSSETIKSSTMILSKPDIVLNAVDNDAEIKIYQIVCQKLSQHDLISYLKPIVEIKFHNLTTIQDGILKLASVRNFLTVLSDYYIPLENISFSDDNSFNSNNEFLDECQLILNFTPSISNDRPFLVSANSIKSNFNELWNNWLFFYKEAMNISMLYFEILCMRSVNINKFLNLAQALESFSSIFRSEEVKSLIKKRKIKSNKIPLNIRLEDLMEHLDSLLFAKKINSQKLADNIRLMRNFFTHYNNNAMPSYNEISAASHILRFMLLSAVYRQIGLSDDIIRECKKSVKYRSFDENIDIVLRYSKSAK